MFDLYDRLSVAKTASPDEIRVAYWNKFEQVDPNNEKNRYYDLHEAFELLIQDNTRRQYDELCELDPADLLLFRLAVAALESEELSKAIHLLKRQLSFMPHHNLIKHKLAEAYLSNGQSGKAVQIYEELVRQEPEHTGYRCFLAEAYGKRGWYRKAEMQFRHVLRFDPDNMIAWDNLIHCRLQGKDLQDAATVALTALNRSKKSGWSPLFLCKQLVFLGCMLDLEELLRSILTVLVACLAKQTAHKESVLAFLREMTRICYQTDDLTKGSLIMDAAETIAADDPVCLGKVRQLQAKSDLYRQLGQLMRSGKYDEEIVAYFTEALERSDNADGPESRLNQIDNELVILYDKKKFMGQIRALRRDFPELYQLEAAFLKKLEKNGSEERLFAERFIEAERIMKEHPELLENDDNLDNDLFDLFAGRHSLFRRIAEIAEEPAEQDEEDEAFTGRTDLAATEDFPEPAIRDPDKVGRNEPCPCGSGKKYKKCCGH